MDRPTIHHLRHSIKIDQQAEEYLVGGGTIFVYARQVVENRNRRHIFAMKCKHATGLRTEIRGAVGRRDMAMNVLMLHVVRCRDLCQQACHHFNDVRHRHGADFILAGQLSRTPTCCSS